MFLFAQIEEKRVQTFAPILLEEPHFLSLMMLTDKAPAMSNTPATIIMSL